MMESGFIAFPLLAKAWMVWFCIVHIMQKLPWAPGAGETTQRWGQTQERWRQDRGSLVQYSSTTLSFPYELDAPGCGDQLMPPQLAQPITGPAMAAAQVRQHYTDRKQVPGMHWTNPEVGPEGQIPLAVYGWGCKACVFPVVTAQSRACHTALLQATQSGAIQDPPAEPPRSQQTPVGPSQSWLHPAETKCPQRQHCYSQEK